MGQERLRVLVPRHPDVNSARPSLPTVGSPSLSCSPLASRRPAQVLDACGSSFAARRFCSSVAVEGVGASSEAAGESVDTLLRNLIDRYARPFAQEDGGDIEFEYFDPSDGVVYVRMHGACQGCSKSSITLSMMVKNMLQHHCPQVQDVEAIEDWLEGEEHDI